jgi:hypothetical protein
MLSSAGEAPRQIARQIALVYDSEDGRIVHQHAQVTLEGAEIADLAYIERRAISIAAGRGHTASTLRVLHVNPSLIRRGTHYAVDPNTSELVELPQPDS